MRSQSLTWLLARATHWAQAPASAPAARGTAACSALASAAAPAAPAALQQPACRCLATASALVAEEEPSGEAWAAVCGSSHGGSSAVPRGWQLQAQQHEQQQQQQPCRRQRARVLDGRAVAAQWSAELADAVPELNRRLNRRPGLAVVLVGSRPDSLLYVSRKQEACRQVGIHCRVLRLPESVSQAELQAAVGSVAGDRAIDGVLVQLPLPPHLDEERVMEALDPRKDVDGFHPLNMGRMLMRGRAPAFVPATPLGVVELLSRSGVSVAGRTAVVLGDSNIVGLPIAALLRDEGAALVTTCHRASLSGWFEQHDASEAHRAAADVCLPRLFGPSPATQQPPQPPPPQPPQQQKLRPPAATSFQSSQLPAICRTADVLVVAVGSPELVRAEWVKPGAVVVDVGINVVPLQPPTHAGSAAPGHMAGSEAHAANQPAEQPQPQQPPGGGSASSLQLAQGSVATGGLQEPLPEAQPPPPGRSCTPRARALELVGSELDGGVSRLAGHYRVVGDVAHEEVAAVASVLTPVPGGVGPMTIAAVLHNTLLAARGAPWE